MYIIYCFLLSVSHLLYSAYYFIQQQCISLILAIEQRGYLKPTNYKDTTVNSKNHSIENSKLPKHLAVLLGHEELSIVDLVKLISWSIVTEIPYISFYDHKGILKQNQALFKMKVDELEPDIVQNIEWSSISNNLNGVKNIAKTRKLESNKFDKNIQADSIIVNNKFKTKIQILSHADGKGRIVDAAKSFAESDDSYLQENNILSELLDEKLKLNDKMPDPDLAIIFGKTMCTYGFLPWQTKITEFFTMPTHHNISFDIFLRILIRFSGCQQRHGK